MGWVEGIEVNVLGLVTGIDIRRPALKLPGFGRIGFGTRRLTLRRRPALCWAAASDTPASP